MCIFTRALWMQSPVQCASYGAAPGRPARRSVECEMRCKKHAASPSPAPPADPTSLDIKATKELATRVGAYIKAKEGAKSFKETVQQTLLEVRKAGSDSEDAEVWDS